MVEYEGGSREGIGDLVDKTIRFYVSNRTDMSELKEPAYSQYQSLIKAFNEITPVQKHSHLSGNVRRFFGYV
ncbi:hypothetical protein HY449_04830 [Candidatus Pacearchaeota archaeon]|nr:hypothetical protein [Candidatus Pacearchaeota archaeon]